MKGKLEQNRQAVIKEILCTYGSIDRLDVICFGVRFHVGESVITEDIRSASEALKREALEQEHGTELAQERAAELELARQILKGGGA
jgi:hypothetical protein